MPLKNDENEKKCDFHEKLFPFKGFYCTKSFQNPLVLCSKPFGKSKKFPYKGVFPFEGFPFNEYELYCNIIIIYFISNIKVKFVSTARIEIQYSIWTAVAL